MVLFPFRHSMTTLFVSALLCCAQFLPGQSFDAFDIYMVNVKTGEVVQLTDLPGLGEFNPSFSHNGKMVVHDIVSADAPFHALGVTNVTTGETVLLEGGLGGNDASWSPNGQMIAFDRVPYGQPNIYLLPAAGGTPTLLRMGGIDPEWSQNSKYLVFTDVSDGTLRTIHVETGAETLVVPFGIHGSWSSNGNVIVYSDVHNLFKISVNNAGEPAGPPFQLTNDGPDVFNQEPSWSNNGKKIVFSSNRINGDNDLWTVTADGNKIEKLTGLPGLGEFDPVYAKNGKYVAYAGVTEIFPPSIPPAAKGIEDAGMDGTRLGLIFPNPFREYTNIEFHLARAGYVQLSVRDARGVLIHTLISENLDKGLHRITWDGTSLQGRSMPAGIYFCNLVTDTTMQTKTLLLLTEH